MWNIFVPYWNKHCSVFIKQVGESGNIYDMCLNLAWVASYCDSFFLVFCQFLQPNARIVLESSISTFSLFISNSCTSLWAKWCDFLRMSLIKKLMVVYFRLNWIKTYLFLETKSRNWRKKSTGCLTSSQLMSMKPLPQQHHFTNSMLHRKIMIIKLTL